MCRKHCFLFHKLCFPYLMRNSKILEIYLAYLYVLVGKSKVLVIIKRYVKVGKIYWYNFMKNGYLFFFLNHPSVSVK